MPALAESLTAWVVRNRSRMPGLIRRLPEIVEQDPDGWLSRVAYRVLGGDRAAPEATIPPVGDPRVIVGPANHAGQGTRWARAMEQRVPGLGARSLAVRVPGGHSFPADSTVPFPVYRHSERWQRTERDAVLEGFDHALIESMRPLFGGLCAGIAEEVELLREHGISVALIAHGTDIRSPRRHLAAHRWSPFREDPRTERLQRTADANIAFAHESGAPLYVSTPDLLDDLPEAVWCPVVVDPTVWSGGADPFSRDRTPVVAHVPSSAAVKGTALVEPALQRLHRAGVIVYRRLEGLPSDAVPAAVRDADILLDQFRIGSYGVAACEALAAGRVVVSHVSSAVREYVKAATGRALPIIEADPDSLEHVVRQIVADPAPACNAAAEGPIFVDAVHSGARSAAVLATDWLSR
ncbi:MAG: hypothetical protein M3Y46_06920 [Actinomycetota bacterium]|nr:hypothetical protein [Actinomycetota bacterium]